MYYAACFVEMQDGIVSLICFAVTEEASNDVHHCEKLPLPANYPTVLDCIKSCERLLQERYFIFSDKVYFYVKNTAASSVLVKEPEGTKTIGIDGRDVYRNYLLMEEDQFDKSRRDFDKRYEESMQGMNREEKKGVIGWGMNESCSRDSEIEFVSMRAMSEPDSFWLSVSVNGEPYLLLVSAMPYQRSSSIMKVAFSLFSSTENKTIGSFLLDYSSRANRFPPYLLLVFLDNSRKVLIFRLVNTSTFANDKYEYDFRTSQSSEDFRRNVGSTLSFSSTPRPPDIVHSLRMPNASIFLYFGDLQPVPASPDGSVYSSTAGEDAMSFRAWSEPWGSDDNSQGSGLNRSLNGSGLNRSLNGSGMSNGLVGSVNSNLVGSGMSSNLVGSGMSSNLIGNGLVLGGLRWRPSPVEVVATGHGLAFDRRGELLYYGDFAQNRFHGAGRQVNPMCFGHHVLRARFVCDMPVGVGEVVDSLTGYVTLRGAVTDLAQGLLSGELFLLKERVFLGYLAQGRPVVGTALYSNGAAKYMGRMAEGRASGNGCLFYNAGDGQRKWCEGVFAGGVMTGRGRLYLPDAKNTLVYKGEFANNELDGEGELFLEDLKAAMVRDPDAKMRCPQLRNVDVSRLHGDVLSVRFNNGILDSYHFKQTQNRDRSSSSDIMYYSETES